MRLLTAMVAAFICSPAIAADYLGLPNQGPRPKLYHNNHDGTFTDITDAAHLNHVLLTMGCNFGDVKITGRSRWRGMRRRRCRAG